MALRPSHFLYGQPELGEQSCPESHVDDEAADATIFLSASDLSGFSFPRISAAGTLTAAVVVVGPRPGSTGG